MGFWIFMLVMNLLIPCIMIGFGCLFRKGAPKEINSFYGYRTTMSMKNKETWEFAHRHFAKTWLRVGVILLPITLLAMFVVFGKDTDTVGNFGTVICLLQLIPLIGSIFPTERALRKNFDANGVRRQG